MPCLRMQFPSHVLPFPPRIYKPFLQNEAPTLSVVQSSLTSLDNYYLLSLWSQNCSYRFLSQSHCMLYLFIYLSVCPMWVELPGELSSYSSLYPEDLSDPLHRRHSTKAVHRWMRWRTVIHILCSLIFYIKCLRLYCIYSHYKILFILPML